MRGVGRLRGAARVAALLLLVACEPSSPSPSPPPVSSLAPLPSSAKPSRAACGPRTPASSTAIGPALTAGPFAFLGGPAAGGPARVPSLRAKVVFQVLEPYSEEWVVTGYRCRDGVPLRFWYGHEGAPPANEPGDRSALLPPTPSLPGPGRVGIGGYVLFSSAERWRIDFAAGGRVAEFVVVDVTLDR